MASGPGPAYTTWRPSGAIATCRTGRVCRTYGEVEGNRSERRVGADVASSARRTLHAVAATAMSRATAATLHARRVLRGLDDAAADAVSFLPCAIHFSSRARSRIDCQR